MPRRLGLDDPVLDLVGHAQAVPAADRVRLEHQVDGGGELLAVDGDRPPLLEADRHVLGGDLDVGVPEPHAHDRLDDLDAGVEVLQRLGLVGGAPDVRVGGVGLLRAVPVRQPAVEQPLGHLLAAAELADERRVEPRLVDAQRRVGEQAVAVEPLDVVALEGGAVAPDLHVVLEHRPHQQRAGDGAAERRGVEVGAAGRTDVERAAGESRQPLLDQRRRGSRPAARPRRRTRWRGRAPRRCRARRTGRCRRCRCTAPHPSRASTRQPPRCRGRRRRRCRRVRRQAGRRAPWS